MEQLGKSSTCYDHCSLSPTPPLCLAMFFQHIAHRVPMTDWIRLEETSDTSAMTLDWDAVIHILISNGLLWSKRCNSWRHLFSGYSGCQNVRRMHWSPVWGSGDTRCIVYFGCLICQTSTWAVGAKVKRGKALRLEATRIMPLGIPGSFSWRRRSNEAIDC